MMGDSINRQDAVNELREYITEPSISDDESEIIGYNDGIELSISVLSTLPSAQKKGRWMPIIEANENGEPYQSGVYCSECGFPNTTEDNFCSECGADMRGGQEFG